ncbi:hypothetical protein VB005_01696 [Metarhizium brunneum]
MSFISTFDSDRTLSQLYHDAKRLPEYASTTLFGHWLRVYIFTEKDWVISTERPTREHHDRTRLDIVVQTLLLDPTYAMIKSKFLRNTWIFWLTAEGKKQKSGREDLRYAEEQAYTKTWNYLHENKDAVRSCWVMTYFGTQARLWACQYKGSGALEAFLPLEGENGEKSSYLDIKENEHYFNIGWAYIKENLVPEPNEFEEFWRLTTSPAGPSAEAAPDPSPTDDRPSVIDPAYYTFVVVVKLIKTAETAEGLRTQVRHSDKREQHFPRQLWRSVKVMCDNNVHADGFVADDLGYWTWTLEPELEDEDPEHMGTDKTKGKGKGKAKEKHHHKARK